MAQQPERTAEQVKQEILQKRAMRENIVGEMGYTFPNSNIDPTMPEEGNATTASVRENFSYSKYEIESLQAAVNNIYRDINALEDEYVNITGDTLFGHISLDPSVTEEFKGKDYVTKDYVDGLSIGGGPGGGIPEAPEDSKIYGRKDASWVEVTGGVAGSVQWSDIENKPEEINSIDSTVGGTSMVSGGTY